MTELNTKKRIRGGHRSSFKRLETKARGILDAIKDSPTEIYNQIATLTQLKMSVQSKLTTLHELDEAILALTKDEELENEIEQADLLTEGMHQIIVEIDLALSKPTVQQQTTVAPSGVVKDSDSATPVGTRLPKLQLKKFSGKLTEWQAFTDSFDSAIHNNPSLKDIDKMNYLRSLLEGQALEAISGLTLTSANYKAARDILQQRYGNKQLLITSHMDELIALSQISSSTEVRALRQLCDKLEFNLRGLQNLGVNSQQYGPLLIPILLNKLPQDLRLLISRQFEGHEGWELDDLLKVLNAEVEARERCNSLSSSNTTQAAHKPEKKPSTYSKPPMSAALLSPGTPKVNCVYCQKDHKEVDCPISIEERKDIVKKQRRCFNCLKPNHVVRACNNKGKCQRCSRQHHTSLCSQEQVSSTSESESSTQQSAKASTSSTNMYVNTETSILLQTCIAQASLDSCQGQTQLVRVLLDSGSQRTYITQQLKDKLNLTPTGKEQLCIKTFGQDCDKVQTVEVVKLCLSNVKTHENVFISALVVPMICSPLSNQDVKFAKEHYQHLSEITLSESVCDNQQLSDVHVHVLIGSDHYWDVVTGETRRGERGPVAMSTVLGWTLSGPVDHVTSCKQSVNMLSSTHVLKVQSIDINTEFDHELNSKLEQFWNLESIEIDTTTDPIMESFNDNVVYRDKQYEVALPWKEMHDPWPDIYNLSHRASKTNNGQSIKIGDIVCVHDENLRRTSWKTGIVEEVLAGADSKIRGAVVRTTKNGKIQRLRRPLQRLCPLEVREDEQTQQKQETDHTQMADETKPAQEIKTTASPPVQSRPRRKAAEEGEERRKLLLKQNKL